MGEHDIVSEEVGYVCAVVCSCGERIVAPTLEQAKKRHLAHWGLVQARASHQEGRQRQ